MACRGRLAVYKCVFIHVCSFKVVAALARLEWSSQKPGGPAVAAAEEGNPFTFNQLVVLHTQGVREVCVLERQTKESSHMEGGKKANGVQAQAVVLGLSCAMPAAECRWCPPALPCARACRLRCCR